MAMLRKAKCLCDQLKGTLRYLGGISSSSIVGRSPSSNYQCRHHYFLPPPPSQKIVDFVTPTAIHHVDDAQVDCSVVDSARFAVEAQNEASSAQDGGNTFRFARVLRASRSRDVVGVNYYVTFEALRGKADMNVYSAEIIHRNISDILTRKELIKWHLVDESFCYPFQEIRHSEFLEKKLRRERIAAKNALVRTWFDEMERRCRGAELTEFTHDKLDSFNLQRQSVIHKMLHAKGCFPEALKMDNCSSVTAVFDIKSYEMVYEHALFAVATHNKNEDDKAQLKNLLWACKCKVNNNWVYRFVLQAANGENNLNTYSVIVKAVPDKHLELIEWYLIPDPFSIPMEKKNPGGKVIYTSSSSSPFKNAFFFVQQSKRPIKICCQG